MFQTIQNNSNSILCCLAGTGSHATTKCDNRFFSTFLFLVSFESDLINGKHTVKLPCNYYVSSPFFVNTLSKCKYLSEMQWSCICLAKSIVNGGRNSGFWLSLIPDTFCLCGRIEAVDMILTSMVASTGRASQS